MAVALILDFPGGTIEQYDQVVAKMELGGTMAEGGLFHAAGSYEGSLRVVDVWEELSQFERFRDEKIVPYVTEIGMPPPYVQAVEVHETKPGSGATPVLVQIVRLPGLDAEGFAAADQEILGDRNRPPQAVTYHVNGPSDGGWCVIDAWDSAEARDHFIGERVQPVLGNSGALSGPPSIEDLKVERTLGDRATAAA